MNPSWVSMIAPELIKLTGTSPQSIPPQQRLPVRGSVWAVNQSWARAGLPDNTAIPSANPTASRRSAFTDPLLTE